MAVAAINTTSSKDKEISASRFYGVWRDDDFAMSSDEMAKEIKR